MRHHCWNARWTRRCCSHARCVLCAPLPFVLLCCACAHAHAWVLARLPLLAMLMFFQGAMGRNRWSPWGCCCRRHTAAAVGW
eukprot:scaffold13418_cov16-Tisochrysis_lutea.AAC.1